MFGLVVCGALAGCAFAAQDPAPGVPVSMVVTIEAKRGKTVPTVERQDMKVAEDRAPRPVTDFTPLRGEHGGLQLMLPIDDSARSSFGESRAPRSCDDQQWDRGVRRRH